jgi:hypothetical protein
MTCQVRSVQLAVPRTQPYMQWSAVQCSAVYLSAARRDAGAVRRLAGSWPAERRSTHRVALCCSFAAASGLGRWALVPDPVPVDVTLG